MAAAKAAENRMKKKNKPIIMWRKIALCRRREIEKGEAAGEGVDVNGVSEEIVANHGENAGASSGAYDVRGTRNMRRTAACRMARAPRNALRAYARLLYACDAWHLCGAAQLLCCIRGARGCAGCCIANARAYAPRRATSPFLSGCAACDNLYRRINIACRAAALPPPRAWRGMALAAIARQSEMAKRQRHGGVA
jgi:hypothetical protein